MLLIEDDFALRANLAELLMQQGYVVECSADGAEAIRRLSRGPLPGAIVVDIMLPRMNGMKFREAQLRESMLRDIPTIAVTSTPDLSPLEGLGFAAVFKKPLDLDSLIDSLADVCADGRSTTT